MSVTINSLSAPDAYSPEEYAKNLSGRKGIIIYEVHGRTDATGHADLWDGEKCVYQDYGSASQNVLFWQVSS